MALLFLDTVYGRVALAAIAVGLIIMICIHARLGFVRLLGLGHSPLDPDAALDDLRVADRPRGAGCSRGWSA